MKLRLFISFLTLILFFACSGSQETTKTEEEQKPKENEIYIFDDVPTEKDTIVSNDMTETEVDSFENQSNYSNYEYSYYVQVGAYSTKARANSFVEENSSKTTYQLSISFSTDVNLWVIQLPPFKTREEAEKVRNEFWENNTFPDAFILTMQE